MFKRFWLWWKGCRSGLSYIGRVKRKTSYLFEYEIKLVNNKVVNAQLVNNLKGDELEEDMIVTVNYQAGKWYFHVPVWS